MLMMDMGSFKDLMVDAISFEGWVGFAPLLIGMGFYSGKERII